MIYFNHSKPATVPATPQEYHLQIARRNLVVALDEKKRLTYCLDEAGRRIADLKAENEALVAENIRLTGQVHALLAVIEQAVSA